VNAVDVLNTITNGVEDRIALEGTPTAIAFSRDGATAYVAVSIVVSATAPFGKVVVINTLHRTVVASIPVGVNPAGIEVTPDDRYVYVTNQASNTVSVIHATDRVVTGVILSGKGRTP
jgi:YVTN family beta-propeller protein